MSQLITKKILFFALLGLMFSTLSESKAQRFGGNRNSFSRTLLTQPRVALPQVLMPAVSDQRRSFRSGQSHQDYSRRTQSQPIYSQPKCCGSPTVYPQPAPAYPQPAPAYPVLAQPPFAQPAVNRPKPARPLTSLEYARNYTADAKLLFQKRQYVQAQSKLDEVVKRAPKNTDAYQFRALAEFAQSDFDAAAADAYDALAYGNTWTRDVVRSLYGPNQLGVYDDHVRQLEKAVAQKPTMQIHFLLAYHHLVNGRWFEGKTQLEKVLILQPQEPLTTKLLASLNAKLDAQPNAVTARK